MSGHEGSLRDDRGTQDPPNEPKAEGQQEHSRQQGGRRWSLIWAGLALVAVIIAGFVITVVAGRVPEDRPRDVPPATATSSILGPPGDNRNNNEQNNG